MLVKPLNGLLQETEDKESSSRAKADYKIDKSLYSDLLCNSPRIDANGFLCVYNG